MVINSRFKLNFMLNFIISNLGWFCLIAGTIIVYRTFFIGPYMVESKNSPSEDAEYDDYDTAKSESIRKMLKERPNATIEIREWKDKGKKGFAIFSNHSDEATTTLSAEEE